MRRGIEIASMRFADAFMDSRQFNKRKANAIEHNIICNAAMFAIMGCCLFIYTAFWSIVCVCGYTIMWPNKRLKCVWCVAECCVMRFCCLLK